MNATTKTNPTTNNQTKSLHDSLVLLHQKLSSRLDSAASADEADAIVREMQEISFRVMITGGLLFKKTSQQISNNLQEVVSATDQLKKDISQIKTLKEMVRSTSRLLGLVDKVLDKIKLL